MKTHSTLRRASRATLALGALFFLVSGVFAINDGLFGGAYTDSREIIIGIIATLIGAKLSLVSILTLTTRTRALKLWACVGLAASLCIFAVVELMRNSGRDELYKQTGDRYVLFKMRDDEAKVVRDFGPCSVVTNPATRKWLVVPTIGLRQPHWYESSSLVLVSTGEEWKETAIPYKFIGPLRSR